MRRLILGMCVCVSSALVLMGGNSFTVEGVDLLYIAGPGKMQSVNATKVYRVPAETEGTWRALYSRNSGASGIVLSAPDGTYAIDMWSIAADPMNPQREHSFSTIDVGEGGPGVVGDLNGDGLVDASDLLILLGVWGPCPDSADCPADLNGDGLVDASDLLILLGNWG